MLKLALIERGGSGMKPQKIFWATPFKLLQMKGNALFEKFYTAVEQVSRTIFEKVRTPFFLHWIRHWLLYV